MSVLPDLGVAAVLAGVGFLLVLGVLVVFVEAVSLWRAVLSLVAFAVLAALLSLAGEPGMGLIFAGLAGALIANQAFEWLTSQ